MKLPHQFGRYLLYKKIAQGGMAEIYRAKYFGEQGFTKELAVKRILPVWSSNKEFEKMFVNEAKILVRLQHQNIVQVFELGRDEDVLYISMEFVDGVDLKRLLRKVGYEETRIPEKFVCFIILEVLKALVFAHGRRDGEGSPLRIVHRDISPQNVLCSFDGEVKITDFGIAKSSSSSSETVVGRVKGKYAYMSPEQARGEKVTQSSDLYSVGILMFELMTGLRLYDGPSDFEIVEKVRKNELPLGWSALLPAHMRSIFKRALEPSVVDRYQSAVEFLNDLSACVVGCKLVTNQLEFSDYLTELFKSEINVTNRECDESVELIQRKTMVLEPPPESAPGRYLLATICLLMVGAITLRLDGSSPTISSDVKEGGKGSAVQGLNPARFDISDDKMLRNDDKISEPIRENIIPKGEIRIRSLPSGVKGRLRYGKIEKEIVTPVTIENIDLSRDISGKIVLANSGYEKVEEEFLLNQDESIFDRVINLKPLPAASLNVNARPWGYVTIPGVIGGVETPVRNIRLPQGNYLVKVFYKPERKWVEKSVGMREGKTVNCMADFTDTSEMMCK